MKKECILLLAIITLLSCHSVEQAASPIATTYDIVIDTDLGGDPDDIQSLFRALHYTDVLKIKGILSTPDVDNPNHPWDTIANTEVIKHWIMRVDLDHLRKMGHQALMPEADVLNVVYAGVRGKGPPERGRATEGTRHLIETAKKYTPDNPLWVLVWGAMTSVAQALYDAPDIAPNIRIYSIGSSNTITDSLSRQFVYNFMANQFPQLWWIENGVLPKWSGETFRGVYLGGNQQGGWSNVAFIEQHIRGKGSTRAGYFNEKCGDVFPVATSPAGTLKEGDSPSFLYLLAPVLGGVGNVHDPTQESWGGQFRHFDKSLFPNYYVDLNAPMETCMSTISKWRTEFMHHWKERWEYYDLP